MARQRRDKFVRAARREGAASRAHFKLAQLDERFGLVRPDAWVLELGAAPGGWTGYLARKVTAGRVIAVDPLPVLAAEPRVAVVPGRFGEDEVQQQVQALLAASGRARPLHLVLSDMAPNISGVRAADQAASLRLAGLALRAAEQWLADGGGLVVKLLQGEGAAEWLKAVRCLFRRVESVKPEASRAASREFYAVGLGARESAAPLLRKQ